MIEEQRAAQNVPICTPLPMNPTVLTTAHSGGSRALLFPRGVTERVCGRLAVWLRAYFS
jgi:hypothetical protein